MFHENKLVQLLYEDTDVFRGDLRNVPVFKKQVCRRSNWECPSSGMYPWRAETDSELDVSTDQIT